jgi:hypothetical protein
MKERTEYCEKKIQEITKTETQVIAMKIASSYKSTEFAT